MFSHARVRRIQAGGGGFGVNFTDGDAFGEGPVIHKMRRRRKKRSNSGLFYALAIGGTLFAVTAFRAAPEELRGQIITFGSTLTAKLTDVVQAGGTALEL